MTNNEEMRCMFSVPSAMNDIMIVRRCVYIEAKVNCEGKEYEKIRCPVWK